MGTKTKQPAKQIEPGFTFTNAKVLLVVDDSNELWAYNSTWKGRSQYHVRNVWKGDDGMWRPGKGIVMPAERAEEFQTALTGR